MVGLKYLLDALHESIDTSTPAELREACRLIVEVQSMSGGEIDCIYAAHKRGPLFDGDIPCPSSRNRLIASGFMAKIVVRGEDGQNACTQKGHWAFKILQSMREAKD